MANAKILEAKQTVVEEITDIAKNSASFILFDYRGLTAEETAERPPAHVRAHQRGAEPSLLGDDEPRAVELPEGYAHQ